MQNKNKIIHDKQNENYILKSELEELEKECNKYLILQENIDNYMKNNLFLLKYKIRKLEEFLIGIATLKCIIIDNNTFNKIKNSKLYNRIENYLYYDKTSNNFILLLNKFNDNIKTKVDLIGLFNQIRGIRFSTKYGINEDSLNLLKKFNNYLIEQKESINIIKLFLDNNIIKFDDEDLNKFLIIEKILLEVSNFSNMLIEDIHLNILIEKDFNLIEQKEDIYKLNLKYIYLLSNSNNKYDIDLYNKTYEKDLNKKKSKKL